MPAGGESAPSRPRRDHGGDVDAAIERWGGTRADWLDLSTGINPLAYPTPEIPAAAMTALPDRNAMQELEAAARAFWNVPDRVGLLAVPGASVAIASVPSLLPPGRVNIPGPTYNEHAAAFAAWNWTAAPPGSAAEATVLVHPNNPDGRLWQLEDLPKRGLLVVDESFADTCPERSLLPHLIDRPQTLVLKSFGKFWGLAGVRLGFAIGDAALVDTLQERIGPWAVSGPALVAGTAALRDQAWARATRRRLAANAIRLDRVLAGAGAEPVGGTSLFRLYDVSDARTWQERLARAHVWIRRFPYSDRWLRIGLPGRPTDWEQLASALA